MSYPADTETKEQSSSQERPFQDLDDNKMMQRPDDDQIPRIKGLIELLNHFFSEKTKS